MRGLCIRVNVPFSGQRLGDIWIFAEGHQLFLALIPIGPTPEFPAGWLDPEVEVASIAKAVCYFRRFGRLISVSVSPAMPFLPGEEKYTHLKKYTQKYTRQNTATPGCNWTQKEVKPSITRLYVFLSDVFGCSRKVSWRRARDSNPRYPFRYAGFQDRSHQPLGQLSAGLSSIVRRIECFSTGYGLVELARVLPVREQ